MQCITDMICMWFSFKFIDKSKLNLRIVEPTAIRMNRIPAPENIFPI